ncbi:hypothetical protein ACJRO7_000735 [Eucalyptus globulus]|uniref:Pentatricopeptide repeat-containing protein n=1 Tax=Eucalyptus globulus TaxID=34317 RepID=A0ABD3LS93_EUCGL
MKTDPLPSPRDFSLLLGAVVRMKHYSIAIRLIEQLRSLGVEDNHIWLNISLNCFCRLKRVDLGLSILGRILKLGFPIDVVASSTLIDGLFIQGKTDQALRFFDDMGRNGPEPDETTYAIIAKGLCRLGNTRLLRVQSLRERHFRNRFTLWTINEGIQQASRHYCKSTAKQLALHSRKLNG